jgi:hypothetical protein
VRAAFGQPFPYEPGGLRPLPGSRHGSCRGSTKVCASCGMAICASDASARPPTPCAERPSRLSHNAATAAQCSKAPALVAGHRFAHHRKSPGSKEARTRGRKTAEWRASRSPNWSWLRLLGTRQRVPGPFGRSVSFRPVGAAEHVPSPTVTIRARTPILSPRPMQVVMFGAYDGEG